MKFQFSGLRVLEMMDGFIDKCFSLGFQPLLHDWVIVYRQKHTVMNWEKLYSHKDLSQNLCIHTFYIMSCICDLTQQINTLRPRQDRRHFPDAIFKSIFLNENAWISIKISLKFVLKVPISDIPALVQIMAWRRSGDKPLSEPMMDSLLTHICVTRPQWVKVRHTSKRNI